MKEIKMIKGTGDTMVQDMFRAVTAVDGGHIAFNPITMVNVCFVKHDGCNEIYAFNNPSDERLAMGTRVRVNTVFGEQDATVVSSIKIQKKYIPDLMFAMCGKRIDKLKNVVGVYKMEETLCRL